MIPPNQTCVGAGKSRLRDVAHLPRLGLTRALARDWGTSAYRKKIMDVESAKKAVCKVSL